MTTISEPDTMALAVTGVTKHYDSGFVLDDVTFDLPKGYIMGLIGPNGAGKSTLIKLILNMIRRDHGSIQVLGLDNIIDEEAVKERLGVVFDSSYLYEQWKVSKVERIVAPLYPAWNGDRYRRYLDDFGLGGAQNGKKKIKDLSRGMQMKLMLAIALSHDAKLLILDEPTSGLDVLARDELMDMLHAYIEDGEHSVLFSTHITVDLERAADFIAYITGGRLYYTGPKDEFEESFRIVKGGPGELAQLPAGVVLGSHTYQTGFDALVRSDSLGTVSAAVADIVVESASIDDIIRLTNARDPSRLRPRPRLHSRRSAMGTLTETVPSRAVQARRGNRGLATALHLDLAYLLGDGAMQSFASVLLAPVFSIMFNGGAFVDGFGFRLGVVMAVFSPAMMVLTVPLIDMQSGYRLRGLAPASRRNQMASRYLMGLALAVYGAVVIALIDGVQPLVRRDWSFTGNLWVAGVGGLAIVLIIAVIMPVSCLWDKIIGLQITVWVFYVVTLIGAFIPSVLPVSMIAKVMGVVDAVVSHRFWLSAMLVAVSAAAYAVSYAIAVRVYKAKEW